jgi:hypothetical protein
MRKLISTVSIFLFGIIVLHAQEKCDTLKLKTINLNYSKYIGDDDIRKLDGAVINIDSFPEIVTGIGIVNVSNDTFVRHIAVNIALNLHIYVDTGQVASQAGARGFLFDKDFLPNDTGYFYTGIRHDFIFLLNSLEQVFGVTMEQITYLQVIYFINYTDKDGYYSDSVCSAGADTAIVYLTKNEVNMSLLEIPQDHISIFPNPACSHFTVSHAQNAELRLYNILGQEVLRQYNEKESVIIPVDHLPQGLYVLKIEKENAILTRKIQITK